MEVVVTHHSEQLRLPASPLSNQAQRGEEEKKSCSTGWPSVSPSSYYGPQPLNSRKHGCSYPLEPGGAMDIACWLRSTLEAERTLVIKALEEHHDQILREVSGKWEAALCRNSIQPLPGQVDAVDVQCSKSFDKEDHEDHEAQPVCFDLSWRVLLAWKDV
eukprot:Skav224097  [mRNA]  locus=scaffold4565:89122:90445:- [translate_table: standard]